MSSEQYDIDYWFNQIEYHGDVYDYGQNYYAYKIYKNIITKIKDIPDGKIVVLGTHNCVSFDLLCKHFGYDRCIGFDIHNPTNHPNVIVKNVLDLTENDYYPISFVHNDIGNFIKTPVAKLYAQQWAAKCVVKNGYFLGRTNVNSAKIDLESIMEELGFCNYNLTIASSFINTGDLKIEELKFNMLSKKL